MKRIHQIMFALVSLLVVQTAGAATITVTSTADSGPGTLRDALASAADGDTIDATGVSGTILLTSGELLVSKSVTITGSGPANLAVDGNAVSRVFHVGSNVVVSIAGMTITNGVTGDAGGGIYNEQATLTVSNCVLSGNASGIGSGIYNDGGFGPSTLTVIGCSVSGNSASTYAGGIANAGSFATLTVLNSLLAENSATNYYNYGIGGAILNDGTLIVIGTTLSGNTAYGAGGGINNGYHARASVKNCTFTGDVVGSGGNSIFNYTAHLEIGNTILNNSRLVNLDGTVTSLGYNLSSDAASYLLNATGDLRNYDPKLGPLQDNGGPTFTHALLPCSPALDAGHNFSNQATDQRGDGFVRTFDDSGVPNATGGDGTDIGAFEAQVPIVDCDGDGVLDYLDSCPDTAPGAVVDANGCSIDQLVPCSGPLSGGTWRNHGHYVVGVVRAARQFLKTGSITGEQMGAIVSQAAQSSCGKHSNEVRDNIASGQPGSPKPDDGPGHGPGNPGSKPIRP